MIRLARIADDGFAETNRFSVDDVETPFVRESREPIDIFGVER